MATHRPNRHRRATTRPTNDGRTRMIGFVVGFAPITTLALALLEWVPLHVGGPFLVGPAMVLTGAVMLVDQAAEQLFTRGLASGLIAVLIYDGTRLPFVVLGDWPDFIPRIGDWLFEVDNVHWAVGYLWRYLGNGAGMGLAFTMIAPLIVPRFGAVRSAICYGLAIWSGLITTLLVAPNGEEKLFVLNAATLVLSLLGHIVYGSVLGLLYPWHSADTSRMDQSPPTVIARQVAAMRRSSSVGASATPEAMSLTTTPNDSA